MSKSVMGWINKFALLAAIMTLTGFTKVWAIAEKEHRIGLITGNFMLGGQLAKEGSGLGNGLMYGYHFSDTLVFELDLLSGAIGKTFTHSNMTFGVNKYFYDTGSIFFNFIGGLGIVNNTVKTTTESLLGSGVAFLLGLGMDFDLGDHFIAGFQLRYNYAFPVKTKNEALEEIPTVDSFTSTLIRIGMVF